MKIFHKRLISAFAAMLTLFGSFTASGGVFAASESKTAATETEIFVRSSEIHDYGTYTAVQSALDSARYGASESNVYKVVVEPGEYILTRALHLYSNTHLYLNGVTMSRVEGCTANMLRTGEYDSPSEGATGYDAHSNITVEGGVLDGGETRNTMIKVAHAKNFLMKNITLKNVHNGHMMEVAGVDGFTVKACTFKDQQMDADEVGYEAIQLDILKEGHIVECRSEDLAMKNVLIEDCQFINCPRGIGTHTAVLNNPFDGIVIRGNSFKDMGSAAIQGMNWVNCEITANYIENTPRGIVIYSLLDNGRGTYMSSAIAEEGGTESRFSDEYTKPVDSNIKIAGNTIKRCGYIKDIYATYLSLGIAVIGKNIDKKYSAYSDGSGALPIGDYYVKDVTIENNTVDVKGYGLRLENVKDITVRANRFSCGNNDFKAESYHGMWLNNAKDISLEDNTVVNAVVTGIEAVNGSSLKTLKGNSVDTSGKYGINLDASQAGDIKSNNIFSASSNGINLTSGGKAAKITDNYILNARGNGIAVAQNASAEEISNNTISGCSKAEISTAKNSGIKIGENFFSAAELTSLSLDSEEMTLGKGESVQLKRFIEPSNAVSRFIWLSSNPEVCEVDSDGMLTAVSIGTSVVSVRASNGLTARCRITVKNPPESIALNESVLTLGAGESFQLSTVFPENTAARGAAFSSNNELVASVDENGFITTYKAGTATIFASTFNGHTARCLLTVKDAPSYMYLSRGKVTLGVGESIRLESIFGENEAAYHIDYYTDDLSVTEVNQSEGIITAVGEGFAVITAAAYNGMVSEPCYVTVKSAPESVTLNKTEIELGVGDSFDFKSYFPDGTASDYYEFRSSDPRACKIDSVTGRAEAKSRGTAVISVVLYNGVSAKAVVKIK